MRCSASQVGDDLVALPFGRRTSTSVLRTLHAIKSPCTSPTCIIPVLHGDVTRRPFQLPLRYGPGTGLDYGVLNPLRTDPLNSSEFVTHGGCGIAGLWLHPESESLIASIIGGDKVGYATATLMTQLSRARGLAGERVVFMIVAPCVKDATALS